MVDDVNPHRWFLVTQSFLLCWKHHKRMWSGVRGWGIWMSQHSWHLPLHLSWTWHNKSVFPVVWSFPTSLVRLQVSLESSYWLTWISGCSEPGPAVFIVSDFAKWWFIEGMFYENGLHGHRNIGGLVYVMEPWITSGCKDLQGRPIKPCVSNTWTTWRRGISCYMNCCLKTSSSINSLPFPGTGVSEGCLGVGGFPFPGTGVSKGCWGGYDVTLLCSSHSWISLLFQYLLKISMSRSVSSLFLALPHTIAFRSFVPLN